MILKDSKSLNKKEKKNRLIMKKSYVYYYYKDFDKVNI